MTPLFDQDSAPTGENRPSQGVGAARAGQSQAEAPEEPSEERAVYRGEADTVEPEPGEADGVPESGPGNGVDGTAAPMETAKADDRAGDGDANPPATTGAGPADATTGTAAADGRAAPDDTDEGAPTVMSSDDGAAVGAVAEQVEPHPVEPEV